MIETVLGAVEDLPHGVVDAHAHVWIDGVEGVDLEEAFVLSDEDRITAELESFRAAGGVAAIDCMPGGAGRNVGALARISAASGVSIVASTGFHLRRYYAVGHPHNPWELSPAVCRERFARELTEGIAVAGCKTQVRPGVIKTASPGIADDGAFAPLFRAALGASDDTGAPVVVHTERGAATRALTAEIERSNIPPSRVILCHMDKRADLPLHQALARAGFLLEYDTFLRPKYDPDAGVWPLIADMLDGGFEDSIACALDLADPAMWAFGGGRLGMMALPTDVVTRLEQLGASRVVVQKLTGGNIVERLRGV